MGLLTRSKPAPGPLPPLEVIERELPGGGVLLNLVTRASHTCCPPDKKTVDKVGMRQGTVWQCDCGRAWQIIWVHNGWSWSGGFWCWASGSDYRRLDNTWDSHQY